MSERIDVSGTSRRGEDAITAAWLENDGPYVALPAEPNDEEGEATLSANPAA
jgi:hypothetical protein